MNPLASPAEEFHYRLQSKLETAIPFRIQSLEEKASIYHKSFALSQGVSLTTLILGAALSANPFIGAVGLVGGGIPYFGTLLIDYITTGKMCPLVMRRGLFEVLQSFSEEEGRHKLALQDAQVKYRDVIVNLSQWEGIEYSLLRDRGREIVQFLQSFPPENRIWEYGNFIRERALDSQLIPLQEPPIPVEVPSTSVVRSSEATPVVREAPIPHPIQDPLPPIVPSPIIPASIEEVFPPLSPLPPMEKEVPLQESPKDLPSSPPSCNGGKEDPGLESLKAILERTVEIPKVIPTPSSTETWERMEGLLKRMAEEGFPLQRLLFKPLIICSGPSQSGKSTIAHLAALVRLAKGIPSHYCTTPDDGDYPALAYTSIRGKDRNDLHDYYRRTTHAISIAEKSPDMQESVSLDEFWKANEKFQADTQSLIKEALQKGDKAGKGVIIITQSATLESLGLSGVRQSLDNSACVIEPEMHEDEYGKRYPTGKYLVKQYGKQEQWLLPSWLLEDKNQYGQPCPTTTLLNRYFPELKASILPPSPPAVEGQREVVEERIEKEETGEIKIAFSAPPALKVEKKYTPYGLTRTELVEKIQSLFDQGKSETSIKQMLWNCTSGPRYQAAVQEWREVWGQ